MSQSPAATPTVSSTPRRSEPSASRSSRRALGSGEDRRIDTAAAEAFVSRRRGDGRGSRVHAHGVSAQPLDASMTSFDTRRSARWQMSSCARRCSAQTASSPMWETTRRPTRSPRRAVSRRSSMSPTRSPVRWPRHTRLLLENTAGGGSTFGCTFEQLGAAIDAAGDAGRVCSACASTHATHSPTACRSIRPRGGTRRSPRSIDVLGLDRLGLIHANDCLFERGSRRDRHAWIGDGFIGIDGFRAMLCDTRLAHVPAVTEMPGERPEKDEVNIERLKELRDECARSHSADDSSLSSGL